MKNKVQLITYADRLGDGTLSSMTDILRTRFDGVYDGVHILPFFTPFDGADAGFDPIDHTKVDERLGSWDDVAELSKTHNIMVDAIVNHMSWESKQFQDVLEKGEESEYYPMFLTMSSVFPNGATEEDLAGIYRPRPGLPFTHYKFAGKTRLVWVSFTPQQVDIDTDSAKGWEYLMSIFRPDGRLSRQLHPPRRRRLWRQGSQHQLLHDSEDVQAHLPPTRGRRQARPRNSH